MNDKDLQENRATRPEGGEALGQERTVLSFFKFFLGVLIVGGAGALAAYWLMNRPKAGKRKPETKAPLVEVREVEEKTPQVTVHAMGTVVPVEEVSLVARVSGQLTRVNPDLIPGGHLDEGETLARIEQEDFKLAVQQARSSLQQADLNCQERKLAIDQRKSDVAQAEKNLRLEQARQDVARGEYELLVEGEDGENVQLALGPEALKSGKMPKKSGNPGYAITGGNISDAEKDLILREPQLKATKAALQAATAGEESARVAHKNAIAAKENARTSLRQAELDLERTTIESPFNAVVRKKQVGVGSYVSPGNPVATLVNVDSYWIEAAVPVDRLKWITSVRRGGGEASEVRVYYEAGWGPDAFRTGIVKRVEPGIESQGRMAKVIVEVKDPRALQEKSTGKPVLLLDSYVDMEIEGGEIEKAVEVDRTALREGGKVWVLSEEKTLDIRPVTIASATPGSVYVTEGLKTGDRLITSDLPTPVDGMSLRVAGEEESGDAGGAEKPSTGTQADEG